MDLTTEYLGLKLDSPLMPGASPYVQDSAGLALFLARLRAIVESALATPGVRFATLREIAEAMHERSAA